MRSLPRLALALLAGACAEAEREAGSVAPAPVGTRGQDASPAAVVGADELPRGHPGPLYAVAGLPGFRLTGRRIFDGAPELPHRFDGLHLFPGRVHWQTWDENAPERRQIDYRYGSALHYVPAETDLSIAYTGEALRAAARNMELLCAVVMWPDGFAWDGTGARRTVVLEPLGELELGTLRAELDAAGRPLRIEVRDVDGAPLEALRVPAWREQDGRSWPAELEFLYQGARIWTQTVEPIETRVFAAETFFVPPDLR